MLNKLDVTVILTVWKRNHLEEQLQALTTQTVPVKNIWIYHCGNYVKVERCLKLYPYVERFHSTYNLKYFGRFSLANHCASEYTWILDDDVIPSHKWIEVCIHTSKKYNAIVSGAGRIILTNNSLKEEPNSYEFSQSHIGDNNPTEINYCSKDTTVDFGCNGWFFRTEWLKYFWKIWPYTFQNGEDIHLSATCKILSGISTVIPFQASVEVCGNLKKSYSYDQYASFIKEGFYTQRINIVKYLIKEFGWKPIMIDS